MHIHTFATLNGYKTARGCFDGENAVSDAKAWLGVAAIKDAAIHVTGDHTPMTAKTLNTAVEDIESWAGVFSFQTSMPAIGEQGEMVTLDYIANVQ